MFGHRNSTKEGSQSKGASNAPRQCGGLAKVLCYIGRMSTLRSHLSIIVLSAFGMIVGYAVAEHLPWPSASAEGRSGPATQGDVLSTHMLEVVGADGRRKIVMGT